MNSWVGRSVLTPLWFMRVFSRRVETIRTTPGGPILVITAPAEHGKTACSNRSWQDCSYTSVILLTR